MREYEQILLSRAVIEKLLTLKDVVQHTDKPTINDVVQTIASDYHILAESDVALIWNGYGYEMVNMKVDDEK